MYESFFGLNRRPFSATPDAGCFLPVEGPQAAVDELVVCAERGQGIAILTAPAGMGKTLICEKLLAEVNDSLCKVFLRHSNFPTRRSLLQTILYELRYPYTRMTEQELRLELTSLLRTLHSRKQAVLLVCDEAHQLADSLLEELRMITDVAEGGVPMVRLVLSGQLSLEERLAQPQLQALNQRVRAQVCLNPLTRQESLAYVAFRLNWAGGELADIFTPEAVELIAQASDGLPRCLNQLCDHVLLLAYVAEEKPVRAATVREALEDLRQLPLHWNESVRTTSPDSTDEVETPVPHRMNPPLLTAPQRTTDAGPTIVGQTEVVELGGEPTAAEVFATSRAVEPMPGSFCCHAELCLPNAPHAPLAPQVQEEFVFDRYATLDAGLEIPTALVQAEVEGFQTIEATCETTLAASEPRTEAVGQEQRFAEYGPIDSDLPDTRRLDQVIDDVLPLLEQAAHGNYDEPLSAPSVRASLSDVGESVEQDISAAVLDLCWDAQQSLDSRSTRETPITRPEAAARRPLRGPILPATEYDVIEPEREPQSVRPRAEAVQAEPQPAGTNTGKYRNLFSRLRRRQQESRRD